ncbi:hypothetical protein AKJ65_04775 [candidate division MSBL1 archaeon SCGC-AAA259E19]|uniref:Uncharacterized protein n=1 Tax=candidate division MSBL1 archaeon SCGC-AAA259E19 TaxID=1698264 RepID=A0A133UJI7_9EURY|nr:hypothetical protein AKJ65_04775 [candidate division MSBL1 archaeon SCGC-AAA259E19]
MSGGPGYGGDVSVERIGIGVTYPLESEREKGKRPKCKDIAGFFSGGKKFKIALWRQEDKQRERRSE